MLATSKRGGARIRKSSLLRTAPREQPTSPRKSPDPNAGDDNGKERLVPDDRRHSIPSNGDIENRIASAEVLNPDDALNLLAQVADRDAAREAAQHHHRSSVDGPITDFPPITQKVMTKADVRQLLDQ